MLRSSTELVVLTEGMGWPEGKGGGKDRAPGHRNGAKNG